MRSPSNRPHCPRPAHFPRGALRGASLALAGALAVMAGACAAPRGDTIEMQRAWTDQMAEATLETLFRNDVIEEKMRDEGVAWGVFEVIEVNAVLLSITGGYGVIIDRETSERTYAALRGGGPGLGAGFTRAHQVYLFRSREVADTFIESGDDTEGGRGEGGAGGGAITWNVDAGLTFRPGGRGPSAVAAGSARGQTEIYHTVQHGVSIGASMKAVAIMP